MLGGVSMAAGSSGGPVSLTSSSPLAEPRRSDSSAPPSRDAGPEEEEVGPGSELGCRAESEPSAPWWPHGEQDGSRERLFVSKLGLEEEEGPEGEQVRVVMTWPHPQISKLKALQFLIKEEEICFVALSRDVLRSCDTTESCGKAADSTDFDDIRFF